MSKLDWKQTWISFLSGATWLAALISTFIMKPPLPSADDATDFQPILRFLIASLIALTYVLMRKYHSKKYHRPWKIASIVTAGCSLLLGITYFLLVHSWSINYYGKCLIAGATMSKHAKAQRSAVAAKLNLPSISDETLLKAYAGDTSAIWPADEIYNRYLSFAFLYTLEFVLISAFIMSTGQSIQCYQTQTR